MNDGYDCDEEAVAEEVEMEYGKVHY